MYKECDSVCVFLFKYTAQEQRHTYCVCAAFTQKENVVQKCKNRSQTGFIHLHNRSATLKETLCAHCLTYICLFKKIYYKFQFSCFQSILYLFLHHSAMLHSLFESVSHATFIVLCLYITEWSPKFVTTMEFCSSRL